MDLPRSLHCQLYLLAYDRARHRFDIYEPSLFGFALRAAMLTDLYLGGFLQDNDGEPHRSDAAVPGDDPRDAIRTVRDQLETTGWLLVRRPAILGVIPARLAVFDEDAIGVLSDRVTEALRSAIDGRGADPRPLAVGMLGVLGQMPTVLSFEECSRYREELREMTLAAIEPILGLQQAVVSYLCDRRGALYN